MYSEIIDVEIETISDKNTDDSHSFSLDRGYLLMRYAIFYNETHKMDILMGNTFFPLTKKHILEDMYILCNQIDVLNLMYAMLLVQREHPNKIQTLDENKNVIKKHINLEYGKILDAILAFFLTDEHVPKMVRIGKLKSVYGDMYRKEKII